MNSHLINLQPAGNFRDINLCPTIRELKADSVRFLRPNIIKGAFENVEHYLDINFRLLRENFIKSLKEFILEYQQSVINQKGKPLKNVYKRVHFIENVPVQDKLGVKIKFNFDRKQKFNADGGEFKYGSLVCFSNNGFSSIIFGRVIDSDEDLLSNGEVIVHLINNDNILYNTDYVMLESKEFYEPYYQVLKLLKTLHESNFPMKKYIVDCNLTPFYPNYFFGNYGRLQIINYNICGYYVPVLNINAWPTATSMNVNDSQRTAIHTALTRQLAIIQGPPGTGKTYTSLKVIDTLLKNLPEKQILIVCFTNHALDQFLEGLLKSKTKILRVGGCSKSDKLSSYTLKEFRQNLRFYGYFQKYRASGCLLTAFTLKQYMDKYYANEFTNLTASECWLVFLRTSSNADLQTVYDPVLNKNIYNLRKEIDKNRREIIDIKEKFGNRLNNGTYSLAKRYKKITKRLDEEFVRLYSKIKSYQDELELKILSTQSVLGMTTTGAAKRQDILKRLRCPIVLVEEASQVLESHVVASLTNGCEHLILVGDHKQLRPNTADKIFSNDFRFNVSLFERLINNGMHHVTLNVQHRMRPEISSLITPVIYPDLQNHADVYKFPPVRGIHGKNVFFLTHAKLEQLEKISSSFINPHEANFIVEFASYLVLQGYRPEDITILSPYKAQILLIDKNSKKYDILENVLIKTVDNYQGEENKIIILSLVRSNKENQIGFLSEENRVCVALSRAKEGLYIMGNMDNLSRKTHVWKEIKKTLMKLNALNTCMPLKCQRHPHVITNVKTAKDFKRVPGGGCTSKCGRPLDCGHLCSSDCHNHDSSKQKCIEKCERACKNNHLSYTCSKQCSKPCSECTKLVSYVLSCGHTTNKQQCHMKVPNLCSEIVEYTHPCGHQINVPCYQLNYKQTCSEVVEYTLQCGHIQQKICSKGPDICLENVQCILACGHRRVMSCHRRDDERYCWDCHYEYNSYNNSIYTTPDSSKPKGSFFGTLTCTFLLCAAFILVIHYCSR